MDENINRCEDLIMDENINSFEDVIMNEFIEYINSCEDRVQYMVVNRNDGDYVQMKMLIQKNPTSQCEN